MKRNYKLRRVVDAIGGTVKILVWQQILTKKDKCENAADFFNIAKTRTKVIIIDEITQEDIDESITQFHAFFRIQSRTMPSEKIEYLGNETIFFETACAEIHQTLAPTNVYKNKSNRFPSIEQEIKTNLKLIMLNVD
ncbi:unnamed protein product [Rotaria magnacalcarata]